MTKEEALKAFRSYEIWDLMDNFTTDELQEMIDAIVSTPSLPSNLDEAAWKYAPDLPSYIGSGISIAPQINQDLRDAFKAGAEWLAGQGETIECSVDWYDGPILDFSAEQLDSAIMKAELEVGDKVVVQIRKK